MNLEDWKVSKAEQARIELQRIKDNPQDAEEVTIRSEVLLGMSDPKLWDDCTAVTAAYGIQEFSRGWKAAVAAATEYVQGRFAGRSEGSDVWIELGRVERGISALKTQEEENDSTK